MVYRLLIFKRLTLL